MFHLLKNHWKQRTGLLLSGIFFTVQLSAQVPQDIPNEPYDIDWTSWTDITLFIILPVVIILLVLLRRKLYPKKKP